MKNAIKQQHIGFVMVVAGIVLLSLLFISYLSGNIVVLLLAAISGLVLFTTGMIVVKNAKKLK